MTTVSANGMVPISVPYFSYTYGRIDQTNGRIDQTNERINDLAKQLDSRYARLMAMLIACTSILVTTMGAAVAVLKP